jgi:hypothetical protein
LHGLVDYGQQLDGEGVEVDLLAQMLVEHCDLLGGVVVAAVEPPVHGLLDAAAGRPDRRGRGQGGGGYRQAGVAAKELTEP